MDYFWAGALAFLGLIGCLLSFQNWRASLAIAVTMDAICDPIRKITPGEPIWVTHLVVAVWASLIFSRVILSSRVRSVVRQQVRNIPKAFALLGIAMIVPAGISLASYQMGWFLVLIGSVSYLAPIAGLYFAIDFGRDTRRLRSFLRLFVLVNITVLTGNILEHFNIPVPGLGGIGDMVWVRYMPSEIGGVIDLISGFYRSPDVSGFHAAHVAIFCMIMSVPANGKGPPRAQWVIGAVFSLFCLFVTGRRKMYGLPVIFMLAVYVLSSIRVGKKGRLAKFYLATASLLILGIVFASIFLVPDQPEYSEYGAFMATTLTDTAPKLYGKAVSGTIGTVMQSGILGSGLGVATQGNKLAGIATTKLSNAWQEDGTSRIFKELGVPGAILAMAALICIINVCWKTTRVRINDPEKDQLRIVGLAVFAANACGFLISHQHISGSVPNAMLPMMMLGAAISQTIHWPQKPSLAGNPQPKYNQPPLQAADNPNEHH